MRKITGSQWEAISQARESGEIDRYGVHSITRVVRIRADLFEEKLELPGAVHPVYTTMTISRVSHRLVDGGAFYEVSYVYEGFIGVLPTPTYELGSGLLQQPIQTHPDFATFAGSPSSPANGAIFVDPETGKKSTDDAVGVFQEFGPGSLLGIDSYLDPTATYTEVYFSIGAPASVSSLGEIDSPPAGVPTFAGRDWLLASVTFRQRGYIFENRNTWQLSGRGGWNNLLY